MSVLGNSQLLMTSEGYTISRSVRLRSSASAYFNRTLTTPTSNTTWTYSLWVKRGVLSTNQGLLSAGTSAIEFVTSTDTLRFYASGPTTVATSTAVFRDASAWYHFVISSNGTTVTAYRNNVSILSYTGTLPQINSAIAHTIGSYAGGGDQFDGYLAEINLVDGQALTPSSFGETDAVTGVWKPKKYGGTYGTNGFYLNFSDNSAATAAAIGKDYSGNGNNWTPNNISLTAGATYDSMIDVPTLWGDGSTNRGNYAVLNPLWRLGGAGQATPSNGNLTGSSLGNNILASTIPLPSTGKWYMEFTLTTGQYAEYGIASSAGVGGGSATGNFGAYYNGSNIWVANGSSGTSDGNQATTTGDIGLIAVDVDNNKLWIGRTRSGTTVWMGGGSPSAGTSPSFSAGGGGGVYATTFNAQTFNNPFVASGAGSDVWDVNFGQRPFTNTPPTGFKALNTQNLPDSTIKAGNKYFDATLWTGDGTDPRPITNSGSMQPDLVWIKARGSSTLSDHVLDDSVRGATNDLFSNLTAVEGANNSVRSFNTGGFSVGNSTRVNQNTIAYVGWQWKKGATPGFDIVTYTGNGASGRDIAHSLGVKPSMIITKARTDATYSWHVWHTGIGADYYLGLNTTSARDNSVNIFPYAGITSSSFRTSTAAIAYNNLNAVTYVAYLFAEVAGFSKFGSYTGNGSADGPFVYCGFRPRYIMLKRSSTASVTYGWQLYDTARQTYNSTYMANLWADTSAAEGASNYSIDILSNGFKLRDSGVNENASGDTYIFAAFAENPFKNSLAR